MYYIIHMGVQILFTQYTRGDVSLYIYDFVCGTPYECKVKAFKQIQLFIVLENNIKESDNLKWQIP